MFGDIGWAELLLIGIVALIVIGPEDLPDMFRQIGRFTAKLRSMGREFSRAMDQAAKDSGVNDVAKDLRAATSAKSMGLDKVKEAADRFEKWDPIKNAAKPTVAKPLVPAPMPATPVAMPSTAPAMATAAPAMAVAHPALTEAAAVGPATQALLDKKAAKSAILKETAEKLKAVDAPAKPRARAVSAAESAVPVAPKPRAPRKPKKADEA